MLVPDPAVFLVQAVARALAGDRKVLLAGDDFDVLQQLAVEPVAELVVVSALVDPDTPAGETATGAPLRMRADWRERPSSKDLVVDLTGEAPTDEVSRVLKKAGILVAATRTDAVAALPHALELKSSVADALVVGEGAGLSYAADGEPGPSVWLAGKTEPLLPGLVCALPAGTVERGAELAVRVEELERALEDAARGHDEALGKATAEAEQRLGEARAAADSARAELAELEQSYQAVRDELAERRVNDQRVERVRERFEAAREKMAAENAELRARLREVDAPAADHEALAADARASREAFGVVAREIVSLVKRLGWPAVPAPPGAGGLDAWVATVRQAVASGAAERGGLEARVGQLEKDLAKALRRARELKAAKQAAKAKPPATIQIATQVTDADLRKRVEALEAALSAEQALRLAEHDAIERLRHAAEGTAKAHSTLAGEVDGLRREAARAALAEAAARDEVERLRAGAAMQQAYTTEVTAMLQAHADMQSMLTEQLQQAVTARDEAESRRRLSDENLRLLKAELERTAGAGEAARA